MKYDAYFHNDFDGRASTAVLLNFFESRGDTIQNYIPVDYTIKPEWLKETFLTRPNSLCASTNPATIVDFLYHPRAAWWFDHHPTTFKKDSWEKRFHRTKFHQWDYSYPSCCQLVIDALVKHFGYKPPRHIKELGKWLDIIDGALYKSAAQTLQMKEPALQLNGFIETEKRAEGSFDWLIKLLACKPMKDIVAIPKVQKHIARLRKNMIRELQTYHTTMHMDGTVVVSDLSGWGGSELRFAPYHFFPKCNYLALLKKRPTEFHIGASVNPWNKPRKQVHIGNLLQSYGGGGHKNVGGLEIKTEKEARAVLAEIVARLNKSLSNI